MDNGIYQITGKQPTATESSSDIVAIARGAGLEASWITDEALFDELTDREFVDGSPVLYAARINDQPGIGKTVRDPAMIRSSFIRGLGTSRGGDLHR